MPSLRHDLVLREQSKAEVVKHLAQLLLALAELYSLEKFGAQNAYLVAEWIYDEYKYEQLKLVTKVLKNPPPTDDKTWKLNPDTIREWMAIELDRLAERREKYINNKKHEDPEFELKYCDRCIQMTNHQDGVCQKCKHEVAADRLKEMEEIIKKVDDFKVPSLSKEDIEKEGQERVVKTYHSPDKSYLRTLELRAEYGRLHTELHTGKQKPGAPTFEEWITTK